MRDYRNPRFSGIIIFALFSGGAEDVSKAVLREMRKTTIMGRSGEWCNVRTYTKDMTSEVYEIPHS